MISNYFEFEQLLKIYYSEDSRCCVGLEYGISKQIFALAVIDSIFEL